MTTVGETFRALHVPGKPFLLANVWDRGSAMMLQSMGAKALATSSAAHAFTMGRADGGTLTRDEALAHAQEICSVARVPVQGDFENGFGDSPDDCATTVRMAAEVGLAGICIEDIILPADDAYAFALAVERIRAAASAARALPHNFILTARADGIMTGVYDTAEAIRRVQAFEAAGADCLYAPIPPSMADLAKICASVTAPVNVLASGPFAKHTAAEFAAIGAARISIGAALARVTHRAIFEGAQLMLEAGDFSALIRAMPGAQVDDMLG